MITGIDAKQTVDFISTHDKSEPKTIWKISVLDYRSFLKIGEMTNKNENQNAIIEAVKNCLRGVENYSTAPFTLGADGLVSEDFMKTIPPIILIELGAKIMDISTLKDEEIKNS